MPLTLSCCYNRQWRWCSKAEGAWLATTGTTQLHFVHYCNHVLLYHCYIRPALKCQFRKAISIQPQKRVFSRFLIISGRQRIEQSDCSVMSCVQLTRIIIDPATKKGFGKVNAKWHFLPSLHFLRKEREINLDVNLDFRPGKATMEQYWGLNSRSVTSNWSLQRLSGYLILESLRLKTWKQSYKF